MAERGHHAGEEFVHVLDGTLLLEVDTAEPQTLGAGDCAYYRADRPHLFRNASADAPLRLSASTRRRRSSGGAPRRRQDRHLAPAARAAGARVASAL